MAMSSPGRAPRAHRVGSARRDARLQLQLARVRGGWSSSSSSAMTAAIGPAKLVMAGASLASGSDRRDGGTGTERLIRKSPGNPSIRR